MTDTNSSYPVHMLPYSEESVSALIDEIIFSPQVGEKKVYLNIPSAFDTEASSFLSSDGEEVGLLYIWMFGLGSTVVYSRDLDDFVSLLSRLSDYLITRSAKLIVYVHFLKYDFSFMKKLFNWEDVFIRDNREPLYAVWRNIEFRDSLALSGGRGLAYIGKHLRHKVYKAVGDLDYDKIRTPQTPLTDAELHYCEMDVRVLLQYIREKIEDDNGINNIPLTNTGYVRRYVRNECFKNRGRYMDFIDGLTMTPDAYLQAEKAFQGGAVGPNINKVGLLSRQVHSYDIKSSYPYVMVTGYYPMQYGRPVDDMEANGNLEYYLQNFCCLFTLEVWDLFPTTDYCFPISSSKCQDLVGERTGSGRVINAMYVRTNVTELDFDTYRKFYHITPENSHVSRLRIFPSGPLPRPIVMSVLKFFEDKTTLDGVAGREQEYMISKNMLNSVYGMTVEKVVRKVFGYTSINDFTSLPGDYVEQVVAYNEKRNRFLFYPWGVWVTAHARWRLYDAIRAVGNDYIYCDTDSVKFTGDHSDYFERVNEETKSLLSRLAKSLRIPFEKVAPRAPNGKQKFLGVWEHEYDAVRFKTIGAKRYLVEYDNGKRALTVAGTNKAGTLAYMEKLSSETGTDVFDLFNEDLEIPAEYAQRTVSKFVDDEMSGYVTDYTGKRYFYTSPSGVYIKPSGYSFSITEEMLEAIIYLSHDGHYTESEI